MGLLRAQPQLIAAVRPLHRDGAAMRANTAAPWFTDYMAKAGPLLGGEPEVDMATPLWRNGI
jgi:hypothetical protein